MIKVYIAALVSARNAVAEHPMCAEMRDEGSEVLILYPAGDFPVGGILARRSAAGMTEALRIMEAHWMGSYPAGAFSQESTYPHPIPAGRIREGEWVHWLRGPYGSTEVSGRVVHYYAGSKRYGVETLKGYRTPRASVLESANPDAERVA